MKHFQLCPVFVVSNALMLKHLKYLNMLQTKNITVVTLLHAVFKSKTLFYLLITHNTL